MEVTSELREPQAGPSQITEAVPEDKAAKVPSRGITWRSIILGLLLIPPNALWIMYVEAIWHSGHPTAISLSWGVIFPLLILVSLNMIVKKIAPRWALSQAEFVAIYVILWIGMALAGHDSLQLGLPAMSHTTWFATEENKWGTIFNAHLPKWLVVQNKEVLKGFYTGADTLYRQAVIDAWLKPVLWWVSFITVLGGVLICITILVRKQWTENERLTYPIVQLPLAITQDGGNTAFFRNKMLWIGIAIGAGIDLLNGFAQLYPNVPSISVRHDAPGHNLQEYLANPPWNAIGWTPFPLYPFIIGLGYLLPLDLSFSVWFFYIFRKLQHIILAIFPVPSHPGMPYFAQQSAGAWFVYFAFAMWMARTHFRGVWNKILGKPGGVDDSEEPVSYRVAVGGILVGTAYLAWFVGRMGMSPWLILPFFGIFFLISTGISRMRAELGPPAHEMANGMDSGSILATIFGSRALGPQTMVIIPLLWWFSGRGYRTNIMPGQLEGFKMASVAKASPRRLGWAMLLALVVGGLASYWAGLHWLYKIGPKPGSMVDHDWGQWLDWGGRIQNPSGPDWVGTLFILIGAGFTAWLFFMRQIFIWWPFHPAGYALSTAFGAEYYWSCMLVAWAIKLVVLHTGGLRLYRRSLPVAFGVIIGEYAVGAFWSAMSVILQQHMYDFAPG